MLFTFSKTFFSFWRYLNFCISDFPSVMSLVYHSYVLVCHSYVTRMYSYVIRMSLVCTRMSSVCHSYVLVCHPYVTHMHSYVICVLLLCTRMSSVCHSHVVLPWPGCVSIKAKLKQYICYYNFHLTRTVYRPAKEELHLGFMLKNQFWNI